MVFSQLVSQAGTRKKNMHELAMASSKLLDEACAAREELLRRLWKIAKWSVGKPWVSSWTFFTALHEVSLVYLGSELQMPCAASQVQGGFPWFP